MKKLVYVIVLITMVHQLFAQDFSNLSFGTDSTLDVVTWNIERFPKNGQITADYVKQIITALNVDLLAVQEIDDKSYFEQLVDDLDGWDGYFAKDKYPGLAYIYNSDEIKVLNLQNIYTDKRREFPRPPLVMEMSFMHEHFILINNHLKCCGDGILNPNDPWDEETRRLDACNLLEEYIQTHYAGEKVIVLGDLNDILTDEPANNVFMTFLNNEDNYQFADMDIAEGSSSDWSYPGWPSHIDHIMITDGLFDEFSNPGSDIQTIKLDDYFDGGYYFYDKNVSDHRPVALKIKTNASLSIAEHDENEVVKLSNSPNPFTHLTTLSFDPAPDNAELKILNMKGQQVKTISVNENQSSLLWDATGLPAGVYYAQLTINNQVMAVRKMINLK